MANWNAGFPVDFTENGDRTRNAIEKHINELAKVYGHLNELQSKDSVLHAALDKRIVIPDNAVQTVYVATNGNDITGDGSAERPYKTLHKAVSVINMYIYRHTTILVGPGVYNMTEPIVIPETLTGRLNIYPVTGYDAQDVILNFQNCIGFDIQKGDIQFQLLGIKINILGSSQIDAAIRIAEINRIYFRSVKITSETKLVNGVRLAYIPSGFIGNMHVQNASTAYKITISYLNSCNLTSSNVDYGFSVDGGIILKAGTQPTGTISNEHRANGGLIFPEDSSMPKGAIVMWSGAVNAIPNGWALCDGQNGRPNLLGKFIRGVASAAVNPGGTGGADSVALSAANLPSHTHTVSSGASGSHTHRVLDMGVMDLRTGTGPIVNRILFQSQGATTNPYGVFTNSANAGSISLENTGGGASFDNRPAFYELAYIIKL